VKHLSGCKWYAAAACPVAVSCDAHGHDVCPECDPCICSGKAFLVRVCNTCSKEVLPVEECDGRVFYEHISPSPKCWIELVNDDTTFVETMDL